MKTQKGSKEYPNRKDGTAVRRDRRPLHTRWIVGDFLLGKFRTRADAVRARKRAGVDRPVLRVVCYSREWYDPWRNG